MGFCLQARDVPCMHSYAHALEEYNRACVDRYGDHLLSRNKTLTIHLLGDDIECRYNGHTCVVFKKNELVGLSTAGWDTPSTAVFINRCSPYSVFTHRGLLYVTADGGDFYIPPQFLWINDGKVTNPIQQTRRVLDKNKAAELRKMIAPAVREARAMADVMDKLPEKFDDIEYAGVHNLTLSQLTTSKGYAYLLQCARYEAQRYFKYTPRSALDVVMKKLMSNLYSQNGCSIDEPVPLGELPKKDRR